MGEDGPDGNGGHVRQGLAFTDRSKQPCEQSPNVDQVSAKTKYASA
jgi:hypothetical protein